jgi:hypothetical protein
VTTQQNACHCSESSSPKSSSLYKSGPPNNSTAKGSNTKAASQRTMITFPALLVGNQSVLGNSCFSASERRCPPFSAYCSKREQRQLSSRERNSQPQRERRAIQRRAIQRRAIQRRRREEGGNKALCGSARIQQCGLINIPTRLIAIRSARIQQCGLIKIPRGSSQLQSPMMPYAFMGGTEYQ